MFSHPSKSITRAHYDNSTSNLVNHVDACAPGANRIKKYTAGGDYPVGRFRLHLAAWVAVHNRPHLAIEDAELVAAFRDLQPNVHVPSNQTIGRNVKLIVRMTKPRLIEAFAQHRGVFHAMLDGWTSANVLSMVGLEVQYVAKNELKTALLDMIP